MYRKKYKIMKGGFWGGGCGSGVSWAWGGATN